MCFTNRIKPIESSSLSLQLWDVDPPSHSGDKSPELGDIANGTPSQLTNGSSSHLTIFSRAATIVSTETLIYALSKFISIPSVSGCDTHREACRQAAIWLRKCLGQLGAQSSLVSLEWRLYATFCAHSVHRYPLATTRIRSSWRPSKAHTQNARIAESCFMGSFIPLNPTHITDSVW